MSRKTIEAAATIYRAYCAGHWVALDRYLRLFQLQPGCAELFGKLVNRNLGERLRWDLAERLLTSGLNPRLLRKLGRLVVVLALDDVSKEENPARIFALLEKWKAVLDFSRLDLRRFCPGLIRDDIFRLMVEWIGAGARAQLHSWALEAVWRRLPESVAMFQPLLQRRPRSRARFKKCLIRSPEDLQWYEELITEMQEGRLSLNVPEPPEQPMEVGSELDLA